MSGVLDRILKKSSGFSKVLKTCAGRSSEALELLKRTLESELDLVSCLWWVSWLSLFLGWLGEEEEESEGTWRRRSWGLARQRWSWRTS